MLDFRLATGTTLYLGFTVSSLAGTLDTATWKASNGVQEITKTEADGITIVGLAGTIRVAPEDTADWPASVVKLTWTLTIGSGADKWIPSGGRGTLAMLPVP